MCGIFGITIADGHILSMDQLEQIVLRLFALSENRGREAAGLAVKHDDEAFVYKSSMSATAMIKSRRYKRFWRKAVGSASVTVQG